MYTYCFNSRQEFICRSCLMSILPLHPLLFPRCIIPLRPHLPQPNLHVTTPPTWHHNQWAPCYRMPYLLFGNYVRMIYDPAHQQWEFGLVVSVLRNGTSGGNTACVLAPINKVSMYVRTYVLWARDTECTVPTNKASMYVRTYVLIRIWCGCIVQ